MKIAFIWQGHDGRYGKWKDGLWLALEHIKKEHEVVMYNPWDADIHGDVLLYWEAPVTIRGPNSDHYRRIMELRTPKALLFAGGELSAADVWGFDLIFTESAINDEDCKRQGLPYLRAFGTNEQLFRPINVDRVHDGFIQATFADWKRHTLFAEAMGVNGVAAGRYQEHDTRGYNRCKELGVLVLPEQDPDTTAMLINMSHAVINTSEFWGGGQRCTLEAMACGTPPIVMSDSPKNREYVEESGFGFVVEPNVDAIRGAVARCKDILPSERQWGREYILSKWTGKHYADNLLAGIKRIV